MSVNFYNLFSTGFDLLNLSCQTQNLSIMDLAGEEAKKRNENLMKEKYSPSFIDEVKTAEFQEKMHTFYQFKTKCRKPGLIPKDKKEKAIKVLDQGMGLTQEQKSQFGFIFNQVMRCQSEEMYLMPTKKALASILQYYEEKYQIQSEVVYASNLKQRLEEVFNHSHEYLEVIGMIIHEDLTTLREESQSHVTPIIVDAKKREVLSLDVLDPNLNCLETYISLKAVINQLKIKLVEGGKARQASGFACRTASTTIIRNALLFIRHRTLQNHYISLRDLIVTFQDDIKYLHPSIDYIDELTNPYLKNEKIEEIIAIREYFKSPYKRSALKTARQMRKEQEQLHWQAYQIEFSLENTSFRYQPGVDAALREIFKNFAQQCQNLRSDAIFTEFVERNQTWRIVWLASSSQNNYTQAKVFKHLARMFLQQNFNL